MDTCKHEVEFARKLAALEAVYKSLSDRTDKLEGLVETVHELATSMKLVADKQSELTDHIGSLDQKLEDIKERPAKRWESVVDKALTAVVSVVIGFILARLGIAG